MKILFVGAFDESEIVLAPIKVGRELFRNLVNEQNPSRLPLLF